MLENTADLYTVHPAVAYSRRIIENLPARTGRSLDEWSRLLSKKGPQDSKSCRSWLKAEYGLGGTTAALIVSSANGERPEDYDEERYLEAAVRWVHGLYAGKKEHLRVIHDALLEAALDLGSDIRISPTKTIVSIYRNHVIAQIKPATLTRIDLGLALRGTTEWIGERLVDTGGLAKSDRITHRIPIADVKEIDDKVGHWLSVAYGLDA